MNASASNLYESERRKTIAIIGTGASGLYVLKNLLERIDVIGPTIQRLVLFERGDRAGMGMPYNPATTDRYNICNISSEELPQLQEPLADWLRKLSDSQLAAFDLQRDEISATETYARLALGEYFEAQFHSIMHQLRSADVQVELRLNAPVSDLRDDPENNQVVIISNKGEEAFDRVVIATGHTFDEKDDPENGYFASPWPIRKLLPPGRDFCNTTLGTLGASLSAFDVVTSIAHRHGQFERIENRLRFKPDPKADQFKIVMHSNRGWLPHLQYEQCKLFREVYRYIDRKSLLAMRDENEFLRLQLYFDEVCRPVLSKAFDKDRRADVAKKLLDRSYSLEKFVADLSAEHEYADAFEGMKKEYPQADRSIEEDRPIHWKEALDDLMYTLSFHADLMSAEDHLRFHSVIMPFLMNVIAAMPLSSAQILLALHEAGRLEMITGEAKVEAKRAGETIVTVKSEEGETITCRYKLFIDCTGQSGITLDQFPFPTLVKQEAVRPARAKFADENEAKEALAKKPDHQIKFNDEPLYRLDGIDVDPAYRIINSAGQTNPRIHDVAFPHTTGLRPYSYGLQACNHTAGIIIEAWKVEAESGRAPASNTETLTRLHDKVANES